MKRHSRLAPVTALLVLALAAPAAADHTESQRVNRDLEGWMVGDFSLIDHNGRAFTQARLSGQWTFVLFGDTRCSERCTSALAALAGMCRRIARTEAVKTTQVLFVSLDPEYDSAQGLRRYLAPFDERFIGARGSRETLARLVEDLIPPGTRAAGGAGSLVLIGPDRDVRGEFLPPYDVLLLTAQFLKTRVGR
ncbi:MAG TPA: SCO family protein [Burkholderiales bacterium]|nr:SCO family protein [Burkholderiales bacterium]